MKLYYLPGACPLASHITLEWIGKPYEAIKMSRDEIKQPEFLAKNPMGSVPVLEDGDFTLTQSAAVLEYLAELNPEAGLLPDSIRDRAEVRRWLGVCNSDIHRTFGNIFGVAALLSDEASQEELYKNSAAKLAGMFEIIEKQLEGNVWIAGARSIADPYLYTLLRWAKAKGVNVGSKNLEAFYARMEADPGVQAALTAQGLI
ncbi:glutathione S-transferase family protein [Allopusillimonas ginsengisoli]|uniref:glutathione S-transferase family protein n=1 Tax=Allopusillimonas ginsengisoli TaxID=453575 RepID=UPI0039C14687